MKIITTVLLTLTLTNGVSQDIGFNLNITSGVGFSNWTNILHLELSHNGQPISGVKNKGQGTNYSVSIIPQFRINKIKFGPVLGLRTFNISKLNSDLDDFYEEDISTQFDKIIQYGLNFEYDLIIGKYLLSPLAQGGFFKPDSKHLSELEKNRIYFLAGICFSKQINKWNISLRPNFNYYSMNYSAFGQKIWDNRVWSMNIDFGVDLRLK